jgi:hypothetical protein
MTPDKAQPLVSTGHAYPQHKPMPQEHDNAESEGNAWLPCLQSPQLAQHEPPQLCKCVANFAPAANVIASLLQPTSWQAIEQTHQVAPLAYSRRSFIQPCLRPHSDGGGSHHILHPVVVREGRGVLAQCACVIGGPRRWCLPTPVRRNAPCPCSDQWALSCPVSVLAAIVIYR